MNIHKKKFWTHLPLGFILVVPFVLQISVSTGLVGYLSYRNGQKAVRDLINQLMLQTQGRVDQSLNSFLMVPHKINRLNLDAIATGMLDIKDLEMAGKFFRRQLNIYPVHYISYGLADGTFIGAGFYQKQLIIDEVSKATGGMSFTYATNDQGEKTELIVKSEDYNFLVEDWYKTTVARNKITWSEVYASEGEPTLWIALSETITDQENEIIGVMSVDFLLAGIGEFLEKIDLSDNSRVFMVERNGLLIANSYNELPFIVKKEDIVRKNVADSDDELVRETAKYLKDKFGDFKGINQLQQFTFENKGEKQFVLANPWRDAYGLDWLVVTVVPENDFMAEIQKNNRNTIIISFSTLIIAIAVGLLTAKWVTKPISGFNKAAKEMAEGNLDQQIDLQRGDELGELAQSFNHMALQLNNSFQDLSTLNEALKSNEQKLAEYNITLEKQVQERTIELSNALEQLKNTQAELIQSEKLAALGHLIAGVAHEINTPLGAIQASISNINYALTQYLSIIVSLKEVLSVDELTDFLALWNEIDYSLNRLSSREERKLRKTLTEFLQREGIDNGAKLAEILSRIGISNNFDRWLPFLKHPHNLQIFDCAYTLSSLKINSNNISLAVGKASKIVFALKSYARQSEQGIKEKASIVNGIETVLTVYHNQIKRGIEVITHYDDLPLIFCYPDELIQVWSNLITNAIQAMNYQGTLTILATQENNNVVVKITDSGTGIDENIKDKIFSPFFTTKPMGEGSGLGLHIVKQIIEKHNGTIELDTIEDKTTFIIKIPILEN